MPPIDPDDRVSRNPLGSKGPPPVPGKPAPMESLPSLARGGGAAGGGLSSLAQSAREKQLKNAKWTLIIVGILQILWNVGAFFVVKGQLDDEIRKAGLNRANLPPDVQAIVVINYALVGGFIFSGIVLVVLGTLVRSFPLPCTIAGLVVSILIWVTAGVIDHRQLASGIIIKIIIIVA